MENLQNRTCVWLTRMRSVCCRRSTPLGVELKQRELSGQELAESNKLNENGTNSKGKLFIPAL